MQNRAARIVRGVKFEEADHNQLLKSLGWLSITQLIDYDTSSIVYKVANGIVPEQTQFMFNKCNNIHSHNTRSASSGNYVIPKMKTAEGQTSFVFSGARVWNNLPTHIKQAQSIHTFQERLKEHSMQHNT